MPTVNMNHASGSEANHPPQSPFPFSPDSYSLPKSIISPLDPASPLLPTNSPTFLVSSSDSKPIFKVPTSPAHKETRDGINSYAEWVGVKNPNNEDEDENLIMFPTYHDSAFQKSIARCEPQCQEDLELFAAEFEDSSSAYSEFTASEDETDSNPSSRSSSPSLEGGEFVGCGTSFCESWRDCSCTTPPPTTQPFIFAEDDISLNFSTQPKLCVDYLAHEWKTDDLWASYKYVHSHRECIRASKRLENALWRFWWRGNSGLRRIDPETIHWLKDSDTTWLYGPFQSSPSKTSDPSGPILHQTSSPTKSLLKKRSPAQMLRQHSEYTFSLLREATGFRLSSPPPSPMPEPQSKFLHRGFDALGLKTKDKKRRVVFNETVVLYREVVEESMDSDDDREDYFRDFEYIFEGVD